MDLIILCLLLANIEVAAFSSATGSTTTLRLAMECPTKANHRLCATEQQQIDGESMSSSSLSSSPSSEIKMYVPRSFDEMVKQVSATMEDAASSSNNKKRQVIRILLPRSPDNDQFGTYYEQNVIDPDPSMYTDTSLVLVPPDESWQGGIMQLYRSASLACQEILRWVFTRKNKHRISRLVYTLKKKECCILHDEIVVVSYLIPTVSHKHNKNKTNNKQTLFQECTGWGRPEIARGSILWWIGCRRCRFVDDTGCYSRRWCVMFRPTQSRNDRGYWVYYKSGGTRSGSCFDEPAMADRRWCIR